jgi:hypothetical protein
MSVNAAISNSSKGQSIPYYSGSGGVRKGWRLGGLLLNGRALLLLVARLLGGHCLSRGVVDVEGTNLTARDGEQRPKDPASATIEQLTDFRLDSIVFWSQFGPRSSQNVLRLPNWLRGGGFSSPIAR